MAPAAGALAASLLALALAALVPGGVVWGEAPPAAAGAERFAGLWSGLIVNRPAELEVEIVVEIGPAAGGGLAGTIDVPGYHLAYVPLEGLKVDGDHVEFGFRRRSETFGEGALSRFEGELAAGGAEIRGEYLEAEASRRLSFFLERIGEPGEPRTEVAVPPLHPLAPRGDELRAAFDADADHVRLILLLSPT